MRQSLTLLNSLGENALVVGTPARGAGWYGPNSGLHSISICVQNFIGRILIEASLAVAPGNNDWFSVLPTGSPYLQYPRASLNPAGPSSGETSTTGFNFTCNVIWVRATVDRSYLVPENAPPVALSYFGTVDSILLNY